jgi:hypothetical protein
MQAAIDGRKFAVTPLIASLWVHTPEVCRYFLIVTPETRTSLSMAPNIAPMHWPVF